MIYVALLRGINVGGNNKIEMSELKTTFELLGFKNVVTYVNSGNVVFAGSGKDQEKIAQTIEKGIKNDFRLDIKVIVRNARSIQKICKAVPDTWENNAVMKTDIMFLWKEVDSPKVLGQLATNPKADVVKYVPGAILWNIHRINFNRSSLPKLIGTKFYKQMTVRNINTLRKLNQMMSVPK